MYKKPNIWFLEGSCKMYYFTLKSTQYLEALTSIPGFRSVLKDSDVDIELLPNREVRISSYNSNHLRSLGSGLSSVSIERLL